MKIDLIAIAGKNGESLDVSLRTTPLAIGFDNDEIVISSDIDICVKITNESENYLTDGTITFYAEGSCARCLKRFCSKYVIEFNEVFAYDGDGENIYLIRDNVANLTKVIYENIVLNVPVKLLCSDDCKGLCTECGVDLNSDCCKCASEAINPQFAKLAKLLN